MRLIRVQLFQPKARVGFPGNDTGLSDAQSAEQLCGALDGAPEGEQQNSKPINAGLQACRRHWNSYAPI
jgi:hypothetical protein